MSDHSGVLVFTEDPATNFELIAIGRTLADKRDAPLITVALGENADEDAANFIHRGADTVYTITADALETPLAEPYADALCALIETVDPEIVLFGATNLGNELAPRIAARLDVGLVTNAVTLDIGDDDHLETQRLAYGGNAMALETFTAMPQLATVPPRTFDPAETNEAHEGEVNAFEPEIGGTKVNVNKEIEKAKEALRIEDAEVIVSCGRGVKQKEDIAICAELAEVLEGSVGCSRPISADLKWLSEDHWVGLSGHKVKPRVYFACGISGQIQHLAGMRDSDTIVAINTDEEAPIFASADFGVVGDLYKVVPELAKRFKGD